jgi:putative oxidoreductase
VKPRYSTALLFVRVLAGLVFWQHGLEKLFGFAGARPEPTLWAIRGVGGVLEALGGPLLVLGLLTRPVAFILSGEMAVAYFRSWAPRGFFPIANGGEEATLNAFLFLWLVTAGAGAYSLDALLARRRGPSPLVQRLTTWEPHARSLMQRIAGFLMVLHGCRELFGVLISAAGRRGAPALALDALPSAFGYIELAGGVLLLFGLWVRPTSIVLGCQALAAYLFIAAPRTLWPVRNGGNEALIWVALFCYLAVAGSGTASLSSRRDATQSSTPSPSPV